jgi:hypothetical protein
MAAARWWRERRHAEEVRERHEAVTRARSMRPLLPLEEMSPGVGLDADTDRAGLTLPADLSRFGDVSSNGSAVERVSVATTDGVTDTRSTSEGRAA